MVRSVHLAIGEEHALELLGPGSTGYSWTWTVEGPEGVVDVGLETVAMPPRPAPGGPPPASHDVAQLVTISACGPGRVVVRLVLRRSWEKEREPIDGIDLEIEVTD